MKADSTWIVSCAHLRALLAVADPADANTNRKLQLLDVREEAEHRAMRLTGSKLIPLDELSQRLEELDAGKDIIVYCRSGIRSRTAVEFLRSRGFAGAANLSGGILAWVREYQEDLIESDLDAKGRC